VKFEKGGIKGACMSDFCKKSFYVENLSTDAHESYCQLCWEKDDISNILWNRKGEYSKLNLDARHETEPFILTANGKCVLQCQPDYRSTSTAISTLDRVNQGTQEKCIHFSCASINNVSSNNPNECETCWQDSDLKDIKSFEGYLGYDWYG